MIRRQHLLLSVGMPLMLLFFQTIFLTASGQPPGPGQRPPLPPIPVKGDTTHTLSRHFNLATGIASKPHPGGFIQRWLVLEPIKKEIARNNMLTDAYLRSTFSTDNFSADFNTIPKPDESVTLGNESLKWYGLSSKAFNFNLYHFTYAINKPHYGILVWLVTIIDCPEEITNVRMAAGCNSGSMWWLNGEEAMILSGDRDMIVDNVTSSRLTLKKGRNIIRGAVINGPGMANFCLRFIDEKGAPVTKFTIRRD